MMGIRMELRRVIADAVYDKSEYGPYIDWKRVETVEFRKGCSEIDVSYSIPDYDHKEYATIDAAPVLTALVQALIDEEE